MSPRADNLVVFDWNGTLLADTQACVQATNAVLSRLGVPPVSRRQYQERYTMPLNKFYENLGLDAALVFAHENEIHPLWHDVYSATPVRLRRGARDALGAIRRASAQTVILSNYIVDKIQQQAGRFGILEHIDDILAFSHGDDPYRRSGKAAHLKTYLRGASVRRSIIVGDTEEEIAIGKSLGMVTVAITDGTCSRARLRAKRPDFMIGALSELILIVEEVFERPRERRA